MKKNSLHTVWIIGNRSDAIETAKKNNLRVVLLYNKKLKNHKADTLEQISFIWSKQEWMHFVEDLLKKEPKPIAILAPTEKSVLPAAWISEQIVPNFYTSEKVALHCTHKPTMKKVAKKANIPCADFLENETGENKISKQELIEKLGLPMAFKTCTGSGSRGAYIVKSENEVPAFLKKGYMAESFVKGTECSVEAVIQNGKVLFQNITEYTEPKFANLVPTTFSKAIQEKIFEFNEKIIKALGAKNGITHTEVFIQNLEQNNTDKINLVFGEMAIRPPGGYIMNLLKLSYQKDFWQIWLDTFLGNKVDMKNIEPHFYSGLRLFHPKAGILKAIKGKEFVKAIEELEEFTLSVKEGSTIKQREGTGQSIGHIVIKGKDKQKIKSLLEEVKEKLIFEIK
ncbi:ATP-grasp domain-containing protein [Bernardetia sp.]|uniref:ATP-grasp domain-containing protein n=1 Tax=Bernardetia sp. TaxID=1937974 RepID=UPI0025C4806E|nr:ATP-grasp domain-containing protein [Bernardetia sp.]